MNKHEDQFFQDVQSVFADHSPEVPEHIYAGIREKMKKKKRVLFLGWSLNNWLLLLGIAGAGAAVWSFSGDESRGFKADAPEFNSANVHLIDKAHRSIEDDEGSVNYSDIAQSPAATPSFEQSQTNGSMAAASMNAQSTIAQNNEQDASETNLAIQTQAQSLRSEESSSVSDAGDMGGGSVTSTETATEMSDENAETTSDSAVKLSPFFTVTEYKTVEVKKKDKKKK